MPGLAKQWLSTGSCETGPRSPKGSPRPDNRTTCFQLKAQTPRPSEPILIPKLRIQFADFPYLHYSIDQRLLTLETCCGYGYELVRIAVTPLRFSRSHRPLVDATKSATLFAKNQNPFSLQKNSRDSAAYAEKTTLPRVSMGVSQSVRVATIDRVKNGSATRFWNMNQIPFRLQFGFSSHSEIAKHLIKASPKP